ncbi:hypothetical protein GCM10028807_16290 [Spirosoma daeguense]
MKALPLYVLLLVCLVTNSVGQVVKHSYRFYGNLSVATSECGPELTQEKALGNCSSSASAGDFRTDSLPFCGVKRTVYHNNLHWGLRYPNTSGTITDTYTIHLYVKTTNWGPTWARIIDFSNGLTDSGIYFKNTSGSTDRCIDFYPNGIIGQCPYFNTSTYYLLTFTRDGRTGKIDVYVNDRLFVSYNDNARRYVGTSGTPIYLFRDDRSVACESGEANFAYVSFTNQYSSQANVSTVYNDICTIANAPTTADFSITPNPSCSPAQNLTVTYTGDKLVPETDYTINWNWDGGRVVSGTGIGPYVVNWPTSGTKNVTLTIKNNACGTPFVKTKAVTIGGLLLNASAQKGTCSGTGEGIISVSATNGTAPYRYSIDSVTYQSATRFTVTPRTYTVFVKDSANCVASKSITVEFTNDINLQTLRDTVVCEGQSVKLITISNATNFSWFPAAGLDNSISKEPQLTPANSISYVVTATLGACSKKDTVRIIVSPIVRTNLSAKRYTGCFSDLPADTIVLDAGVSANVTYRWAMANGTVVGTSQQVRIQQPGTYVLRLTNDQQCETRDTIVVEEMCQPLVFVPDAFTPNGDAVNDVFEVKGRLTPGFTLSIYNRWGELIYASDKSFWDGNYRGEPCQTGVYTWEIRTPMQGNTQDMQLYRKAGQVVLIR